MSLHCSMDDTQGIIKIVQIKSKDRIIFPKKVRDVLGIDKGNHIAYIKDESPGIRIQKVNFEDINNHKK